MSEKQVPPLNNSSLSANLSPANSLKAIIDDNYTYTPPELDFFNQDWNTLQNMGRLISKSLNNIQEEPISPEFGRLIDLSIRFFVNETLKVQTISSTKLYLQNSNGPKSLTSLQNQLLIFGQENDRLLSKIKELSQELADKEKILSEKEINSSQNQPNSENSSLKTKLQTVIDENKKLYDQLQKKEVQLEKTKHNISLQRSKIAELEAELTEMKLNGGQKPNPHRPRSSSFSYTHNPVNDQTEITVELQNDVSTSPSYEQEAIDNISKVDAELNEQQQEIDEANNLMSRFQATILEDESLLNEHERQLKEFANDAGCLEYDLVSMDKVLSSLSKSNKIFKIDNERMSSLINEIRLAIGQSVPLENIPKRIIELKRKIKSLENEEENQTKKVLSSLVLFLTKILEGKDEIIFGQQTVLKSDKQTRDKIKDAIQKSLSFVVSNDGFPLFESSSGDESATTEILNNLTIQNNSNAHAVILLLSAVNGKLISLLRNSQKTIEKITKFFSIPIDTFCKNISLIFRRIETTLLTFKKPKSSNMIENMKNYIDSVDVLIKNSELELRPIVEDRNINICDVPIVVKTVLESQKKENEENKEKIEKLRKEKKNQEDSKAEKEKLKEEIVKLNNFNNELEETISTLRGKLENAEQKFQNEKYKSDRLKIAMKNREESFQKRADSLLQIEKERYDDEIKRKQEIWDRQKLIYESRVSHLSAKIEASKDSDLSLLSDEKSVLSVNARSLGNILCKCFTIKGEWTDDKVTKAVMKLVDIVRNLEYEKISNKI